jgi:glucuronate isomerase
MRPPTRSTTRSTPRSTPNFRPRALYERFDIEFIATTDDPCDDPRHHIALANDPAWEGKVAPTFRPASIWSRPPRPGPGWSTPSAR